jgi:hypothetical protein
VFLLGDSVAVGESLPLAAAFRAGGAGFRSIPADGGGNVVGPFSDKSWEQLPGRITGAKPNVIVYQITTHDWDSRAEQQAAYAKLLATATGASAKLVFVTMPPIKADDFYQPHLADLARTSEVAGEIAAGGKVTVLDATEVWGTTYRQTKDGKADRSEDGIHLPAGLRLPKMASALVTRRGDTR